MKMNIEQRLIAWPRYSKYEIVADPNGTRYIRPTADAHPWPVNSVARKEELVIDAVNILQVPSVIGKYKNGRYKELSHLVKHYSTDRVKVIFDKPTSINLDGEQRMAEVADIRLAEEKIRFFYPKGLVWQKAKEPATV